MSLKTKTVDRIIWLSWTIHSREVLSVKSMLIMIYLFLVIDIVGHQKMMLYHAVMVIIFLTLKTNLQIFFFGFGW